MQHGRSAGQALGGEKSGQFDRPPQGSRLQPTGIFTQGHDSDFHFHQAFLATFNLRGTVLQPSFADWYSGRRMAQRFALDQFAGECDAVQP